MKDLIVLVADSNMKACFNGLLPRFQHVYELNPITFDVFTHPGRDPGCRTQSDSFLSSFIHLYRYSLIVFDKLGCGSIKDTNSIVNEVSLQIKKTGWDNRFRIIIIEPELEVWMWIKKKSMAKIIHWRDYSSLEEWVKGKSINFHNDKPVDPKKAFEMALYESRKKRSSSIYYEISSNVSFVDCQTQSFINLKDIIIEWFGKSQKG